MNRCHINMNLISKEETSSIFGGVFFGFYANQFFCINLYSLATGTQNNKSVY